MEKYNTDLSILTDDELIGIFNRETKCEGWVSARGRFLNSLKVEILNRSFNSEILFEMNTDDGSVKFFRLKHTVKLVDNILVIH